MSLSSSQNNIADLKVLWCGNVLDRVPNVRGDLSGSSRGHEVFRAARRLSRRIRRIRVRAVVGLAASIRKAQVDETQSHSNRGQDGPLTDAIISPGTNGRGKILAVLGSPAKSVIASFESFRFIVG